jgi:hypothetical protein
MSTSNNKGGIFQFQVLKNPEFLSDGRGMRRNHLLEKLGLNCQLEQKQYSPNQV